MTETSIHLKAGREKSVLARHPWIFASAVDRVEGKPQSGETVLVKDSRLQIIALAAFSPASQIRARVWSLDVDETIDDAFLRARIAASIDRRKNLMDTENTNALRLIYGEADGLPGLIVDQFRDTLVLQILSVGPEKFRKEIIDVLDDLLHPRNI